MDHIVLDYSKKSKKCFETALTAAINDYSKITFDSLISAIFGEAEKALITDPHANVDHLVCYMVDTCQKGDTIEFLEKKIIEDSGNMKSFFQQCVDNLCNLNPFFFIMNKHYLYLL